MRVLAKKKETQVSGQSLKKFSKTFLVAKKTSSGYFDEK